MLVDGTELLADGSPDATLRATLEAALQLEALGTNLTDAGLTEEQAAAALQPRASAAGGRRRPVTTPASPSSSRSIATILLFLGIQGNGASSLLSGALEEKCEPGRRGPGSDGTAVAAAGRQARGDERSSRWGSSG